MTTYRRAARVLLVDPTGRVLLLHGRDPDRPDGARWWFTPGGGLDPGEDDVAAARREVAEETGLVLGDLGQPLGETGSDFEFMGERLVQQNVYFGVRVEAFEPVDTGWSDIERRSVMGHRWWSPDELASTHETVYPAELVDLLARMP